MHQQTEDLSLSRMGMDMGMDMAWFRYLHNRGNPVGILVPVSSRAYVCTDSGQQ